MAVLTLQLLVNAVALGAAYALVALGFVLVINATGAVNFAQGDLVMAGGFASVAFASVVPVSGLVLLPAVMLATAVLGLALSAVAFFPLQSKPPVSVFISTIAVGILLQNTANGLFGAAPRLGPPIAGAEPIEFAGLVLGRQSLAIVLVTATLVLLLHWLFARTQFGRKLRATAQDPEIAAAIGIPVNAMIAATFALSAGLAGAAGLLLANQFFVTPTEGANLILKAYIAVAIGGWGNIAGAVAGALLIAMFETLVAAVVSYPVAEGLLFATLLAILFFRPEGLLGEAIRRRA